MKNPVNNFIYYLENTLIPDLIESGSDNTAKDFKTLVKFLNGAERANSYTRKAFVKYLEDTLIPDLRLFGKTCTPDDFQTGVTLLYWMHNG